MYNKYGRIVDKGKVKMIEFVSKKERKVANARALKIVRELQKKLTPKYRIDPRLVGSARYNAVVCDDNGVYDMDYQLLLTCNCKCFDADTVRKDFFADFNAIKNTNEKVENSTSVITVRVSDNSGKFTVGNEKFSFDFAIVKEDNAGSYITRRSQDNKYVWNKLPNRNSCTYQRFRSLDYRAQNSIIDKVVERKIKEKAKPKDQRIASCAIFIEEVNNYGGKR